MTTRLNLYQLSQESSTGPDCYDSCIVAAENEYRATRIHPNGSRFGTPNYFEDNWALPNKVTATLIGVAEPGIPEGVLVASFNAW